MPLNNHAYLEIDYNFNMTYSLPYFKCAINQWNKWKLSTISYDFYLTLNRYRSKYSKSVYFKRCIMLTPFKSSFSAYVETFMNLFAATHQFFPTNNCNHSCMPWYRNRLQWLSCPTKILRIWKEHTLKSQSYHAPKDILRNGGMWKRHRSVSWRCKNLYKFAIISI